MRRKDKWVCPKWNRGWSSEKCSPLMFPGLPVMVIAKNISWNYGCLGRVANAGSWLGSCLSSSTGDHLKRCYHNCISSSPLAPAAHRDNKVCNRWISMWQFRRATGCTFYPTRFDRLWMWFWKLRRLVVVFRVWVSDSICRTGLRWHSPETDLHVSCGWGFRRAGSVCWMKTIVSFVYYIAAAIVYGVKRVLSLVSVIFAIDGRRELHLRATPHECVLYSKLTARLRNTYMASKPPWSTT